MLPQVCDLNEESGDGDGDGDGEKEKTQQPEQSKIAGEGAMMMMMMLPSKSTTPPSSSSVCLSLSFLMNQQIMYVLLNSGNGLHTYRYHTKHT